MAARAWAKRWIIIFVPRDLIEVIRFIVRQLPHGFERYLTERIFTRTPAAPSFLDASVLKDLQTKYRPPTEYGYDPKTLKIRGAARTRQLLSLPGVKHARSFLELGCWDGMVCAALAEKGRWAIGVDSRSTGFDSRAKGANVQLLKMDASDLKFPDESFDCVFSYDAFEHFERPEAVFREAIRVTRKGGYIYLDFGPLYYSPYGEHAYRSITVPYCQFLFSRDALNEFVARNNLQLIDFNHVNGWSIDNFRQLWSQHADLVRTVRYRETMDWSHLDLIRQFPACFKNKSTRFENFLISHVRVLFQKTASAVAEC